MSLSLYAARRRAFAEAMAAKGRAVAVLFAARTFIRNNDVEHDYRQDSDFFWLTGLDEPDSVLVLRTGTEETAASYTLFVRPRDKEREIWDGPRTGVEGAVGTHGADAAYEIGRFAEELPKLLEDRDRLHYRLGKDRANDDRVLGTLDRMRGRGRATTTTPSEIVDPSVILHELRLRKSVEEVALMRRAAEITAEGHATLMATGRPGVAEYELDATLLSTFRRHGSERVAYASIVGSGPNACILHYRAGNRRIGAGELVLVDAGSEYGYYASDVTRTFPADGTFSEPQRELYQLVLDAQEAALAATKPGATIDGIHKETVQVLTEGLVRLGLIEGPVDDAIVEERYKAYYMHRTSHWLGMDVHDVGLYYVGGHPRPLEPGMVITIEPGLYVSPEDRKCAGRYAGIGIRIEDDILVTETGYDNLTKAIPKTVAEVEAACAK